MMPEVFFFENIMRKYDVFTLYVLTAYLIIFFATVFIKDPHNARILMAGCSFFLLLLSLIRTLYFRQRYDWIDIIGYGLIGIFFCAKI
jgi:hypothetical protein